MNYFTEKLEEIYTVVHWDQRGAGKTLSKNPNKYPTIDLMIDAPRKKFFLIPNAGHMLMTEKPELFCDALLEINNMEKCL